jgi:FkbM family methyltransferase
MNPQSQLRLAGWLRRVRPASLAARLKRWLRLDRIEFTGPQGTFWVDPASNFGARILRGEPYEPEMTAALQRLWRRGGTFLDIGANEGYFSVLAQQAQGETGRIVAVEPQSRLQEVLRRNLDANGASSAQIAKVALGHYEGIVEMHLFPDMNTGASGLSRPTKYAVPTEKVRLTTLDQLMIDHELDYVDVGKVDIESFEYELFATAWLVLQEQRIGALVVEIHPKLLTSRGVDLAYARQVVEDCGYQWQEVGHELILLQPKRGAE